MKEILKKKKEMHHNLRGNTRMFYFVENIMLICATLGFKLECDSQPSNVSLKIVTKMERAEDAARTQQWRIIYDDGVVVDGGW